MNILVDILVNVVFAVLAFGTWLVIITSIIEWWRK